MTKKNTTTPRRRPQAQPAATRDTYISINREEMAALNKVGFRERWLYMQAKWLATFRTGVVGKFGKQRLSYPALADLVTAPEGQGRGLTSIDDKEAARIVERLQLAGLIANLGRREGNGGLVFELPLSPIQRKKYGAVSDANLPDDMAAQALILPDDDRPPFDESPASMPVCDDSPSTPSVVALTESKINTGGARSAEAEPLTPLRATGALPLEPFAAEPAPPPMAAGRAGRARRSDGTLTAEAIRDRLADDWTFCSDRTVAAMRLYCAWEQAGLTADMLFEAMTAAGAAHGEDADPLSPEALIPWLVEAGAAVQPLQP